MYGPGTTNLIDYNPRFIVGAAYPGVMSTTVHNAAQSLNLYDTVSFVCGLGDGLDFCKSGVRDAVATLSSSGRPFP
jgi:hypothetical protein